MLTKKDKEKILNKYISTVRALCKKNKVQILLSKKDSVLSGGQDCAGFFDDTKPMLAVAVGKPFEVWSEIFIHEACHLDQYLEQSKIWLDHKVLDLDATGIMDLWLNDTVELTRKQSFDVVMKIINVERDCEERVVEKIEEFGLPIDIALYTKKANAYVLGYHVIRKLRRWYSKGKSPYSIKKIVDAMPDHFDIDYENPPRALLKIIEKYCFNTVR